MLPRSWSRKAVVENPFGPAFLDASPDAIILIEDGIITQCNDATVRMYGYPREKILGQAPDFFGMEFQPCGTPSANLSSAMLKKALEEGHNRFTWINRHSSGKSIPLLVTLMTTQINGNLAVIAAAQDYAQTDAMTKQIAVALSAIANGDLSNDLEDTFQPEYESIRINLNKAADAMRRLIGGISESVQAIRTGSGEIAQASEDLARRTENDAASLEETSASMAQMDARLRTSASAATVTVARADQAMVTLGEGRQMAADAAQAMSRVSASAKGIDSVIQGVDKIAFQTRVLAMNAAVEAGRAGDAGRGFAVVADLVSALAMRAEEEAKRARDLLGMTQSEVVTAVEAVTQVDGALANIWGDVSNVHELLGNMAADNHMQAATITEISAAIGSMDQSTQQNAAMVEETSAAARNLATEVVNLAEQASHFKLGRDSRHSAPRKSSPVTQVGYRSLEKVRPAASSLVSADDWNSF